MSGQGCSDDCRDAALLHRRGSMNQSLHSHRISGAKQDVDLRVVQQPVPIDPIVLSLRREFRAERLVFRIGQLVSRKSQQALELRILLDAARAAPIHADTG